MPCICTAFWKRRSTDVLAPSRTGHGTLTADLRMWNHSGIGRYLRNLWPLLQPQLAFERVRALVPAHLREQIAAVSDPRVEVQVFDAPIYSPAEQLAATRGLYREAGLLWVPHYNVPLLYGGPLVTTVHDVAPLVLPEALGSVVKRTYARMLMGRATRHAVSILTVSQFTARELQSHLAVAPKKIVVTPLGLDTGWSAEPPAPHREDDDVPYVLFVGNVKPNKNLMLLLHAASLGGAWRIVVAGRVGGFGTGDKAVQTEALKLGDRVRFAGEVSDDELRSLYAGAEALCMPSLYEGFGLPVLEAMASGCPVVCADTSSLPEVAGDAALYFDPTSADAAARLCDLLARAGDAHVRAGMRERGYRQARRFSFAACARQTAEVLHRAASASHEAA